MPRAAGMQLLGAVNRQEIDVHVIEHPVPLIPTAGLNRAFQRLCLRSVAICFSLQAKPRAQFCHCQQFPVHQAVEVDGSRAAVRAVEGAGVIVHADDEIVQPEIQTRFMPAVACIPPDKGFVLSVLLPQPFGIPALLRNEQRVLRKAGLVDVFLTGVFLKGGLSPRPASGCAKRLPLPVRIRSTNGFRSCARVPGQSRFPPGRYDVPRRRCWCG